MKKEAADYAKNKVTERYFYNYHGFVMVYAMVCYNIAIDKGGMSNQIFLLAFHEMPIMWPIAAILEFFVVEKIIKNSLHSVLYPQQINQYSLHLQSVL